jgi:REP element-mobilizing transposase RayT
VAQATGTVDNNAPSPGGAAYIRRSYSSMASTYTNLLYHIIFSTKERRPFINPKLRIELHPYIGGIIRDLKGEPIEIGGVEDHIHILAKFPPNVGACGCAARDKIEFV